MEISLKQIKNNLRSIKKKNQDLVHSSAKRLKQLQKSCFFQLTPARAFVQALPCLSHYPLSFLRARTLCLFCFFIPRALHSTQHIAGT